MSSEHQQKPVQAQIKPILKEAIFETLRVRGRRRAIQAVAISSIFGIYFMFQNGILTGLLLWFILSAAMFIVNILGDSRLHITAARRKAMDNRSISKTEVR